MSALKRLRQERGKFEASMGYVVIPCLKKKKTKINKKTCTHTLYHCQFSGCDMMQD
jgi:hypothetical protein